MIDDAELMMLGDAVRSTLAGDDTWPDPDRGLSWRPTWTSLARLDVLGLLGGEDGSLVAATAVSEECGRALYAGPVVDALFAHFALQQAGDTRAAGELAAGRRLVLFPHQVGTAGTQEGSTVTGLLDVAAELDEDSDQILLGTAAGTILAVDQSSVSGTATPIHTFDVSRAHRRLTLSGTPASEVGSGDHAVPAVSLSDARGILTTADTIGAVSRGLDLTVGYAKDRPAFGSPIGQNQAVAYPLVRHTLTVRQMRLLNREAAIAFDDERADAHVLALAAQSFAAEHAPQVLSDCIQLSGAIGFTWEYGLHFLSRRVQVNAAAFGGTRGPLAELAELRTTSAV